ncbi:MAG: flagellar export protein FliJ [Alphaproteobacteria bacterium]
MAKLDSLIRVRKHKVDQQQKVLADLYRRAEALKQERDTLETRLAIESETSKDVPPDMLRYFASFVKKMRKSIKTIDDKRERLENQIKIAQERLRDAYAEQKKVEIIHQRRKDAQKAEEQSKESQELDAIAIEGFRRKDDA